MKTLARACALLSLCVGMALLPSSRAFGTDSSGSGQSGQPPPADDKKTPEPPKGPPPPPPTPEQRNVMHATVADFLSNNAPGYSASKMPITPDVLAAHDLPTTGVNGQPIVAGVGITRADGKLVGIQAYVRDSNGNLVQDQATIMANDSINNAAKQFQNDSQQVEKTQKDQGEQQIKNGSTPDPKGTGGKTDLAADANAEEYRGLTNDQKQGVVEKVQGQGGPPPGATGDDIRSNSRPALNPGGVPNPTGTTANNTGGFGGDANPVTEASHPGSTKAIMDANERFHAAAKGVSGYGYDDPSKGGYDSVYRMAKRAESGTLSALNTLNQAVDTSRKAALNKPDDGAASKADIAAMGNPTFDALTTGVVSGAFGIGQRVVTGTVPHDDSDRIWSNRR